MVRARGNRSSSSHSAPRHAPAAAPVPPQQPKVTNIYVSQQPRPGMMGGGMGGGGMGGGMLGTMAAVAGGSVIGHGISNMLFSRSEPPAAPEQVQQVAQAYNGTACQPYVQTYEKCLQATNGNADQCKYVWESFMECQEKLPRS